MKNILIILFTIISFTAFANNDLVVKLDQNEVILENNFSMVIQFEHNGEEEPYISFDPRNAELIDSNSNDPSRIQVKGYFAGGNYVQKKIYNYKYTFQPVKSGYSYIRNIKIDLGTRILKHKTLKIKVLSKARNLGDYVLRAEVDKEEVYVGEGVSLNYYLYFKSNITQPDVRKFPKLKNFLKRFELPRGGVERVNLQGKIYKRLLIYKAKVYPIKSGKVTVDPVEVSFQYPETKRGRRDVFGMSMNFSTATYKTKKMRSRRVTLNVLPLPTENVPKNFTGLVGDHTFELKFVKNKILVNDILEARLEVTGEGALEKLDPPKIIRNDAFEEFEAKTEIVELGNLASKKVIDYTFLGKRSTKLEPSMLKLSIFDPVKRQYVEKDIQVPALQVFGTGSSSQVIESKESDTPQTETPISETTSESSIGIVGPIYQETAETRIFNLSNLNLILFALILLILLSNIKFSVKSQSLVGLGTVKRDLNYKNIHDFILHNGGEGDTVREMLKNSKISSESRAYMNDLLDKAEKNEYKGSGIKLTFNKKHFEELLKAKINESHKES